MHSTKHPESVQARARVRFTVLRNASDNVLRPTAGWYSTLGGVPLPGPGTYELKSFAEFRQLLVHQRGGKNSLALLPRDVRFAATAQCFCEKFSGEEDTLHRASDCIRESPSSPFVALDVDHTTLAQVEAIASRARYLGLTFAIRSTHSYGSPDKVGKCPIRIYVELTRGVAAWEMKGARLALAELLEVPYMPPPHESKRVKDCLTDIALFFLPACADDDARFAMRVVEDGDGIALDPGELGDLGQEHSTAKAAPLAGRGRAVSGLDLERLCEVWKRTPDSEEARFLDNVLEGRTINHPHQDGFRAARIRLASALAALFPDMDCEGVAEHFEETNAAILRQNGSVARQACSTKRTVSLLQWAQSKARDRWAELGLLELANGLEWVEYVMRACTPEAEESRELAEMRAANARPRRVIR